MCRTGRVTTKAPRTETMYALLVRHTDVCAVQPCKLCEPTSSIPRLVGVERREVKGDRQGSFLVCELDDVLPTSLATVRSRTIVSPSPIRWPHAGTLT